MGTVNLHFSSEAANDNGAFCSFRPILFMQTVSIFPEDKSLLLFLGFALIHGSSGCLCFLGMAAVL